MIFGKYEYSTINLDDLVVLPQVRKVKNAKLDDLAESISITGLLNPLDVVKLNYEELSNHINFLNQLWKKNIDIKSFKPIDGFFYVLVAGHSRLEALKLNAQKNNRKDKVEVKIHKVGTSEGILAIQLSENIYKEPSIEERAIAIIETYRFGLNTGKWENKEAFVKQNETKFSRRILNDALAFSDLPLEAQEYIFSKNTFFAVGVELGKLYPLIEKFEATLSDDQTNLNYSIRIHYAKLLMELQKAGSVKKSLAIVDSHRKSLLDHFRPKEEVQQELFNFWQESGIKQGEERIRQLLAEHGKTLKAIKGMPFEYFIQLFTLDFNLTGIDHSEEVGYIKQLYYRCQNGDPDN